ncbi:hypothetical protein F4778DRAFT_466939 [Xylariomycetidae sp. FL2044]|nr:hypothetical protein F4778DRAFT_466939 [Xylariomycetidae sp. FL2044]
MHVKSPPPQTPIPLLLSRLPRLPLRPLLLSSFFSPALPIPVAKPNPLTHSHNKQIVSDHPRHGTRMRCCTRPCMPPCTP